jgi:type IV pilus assembly protein PilP
VAARARSLDVVRGIFGLTGRGTAATLIAILLFAAPISAQPPAAPQPAAPQTPAPAMTTATPATGAPAPGTAKPATAPTTVVVAEKVPFHYDPQGRRDPFVSLMARGVDARAPQPGRRVEGPAALTVAEVSLKGIVLSRGEYVAMIQGPDTKTFIVRANEKLLDGTVKAITAQAMLIIQDVNDPLSLVKQREVRKVLRAPQEGK